MQRRDFWDSYLRTYDALNGFGDYRASVEQAADQLGAVPGGRVLDAGSGTGNLAVWLAGRGSRVVGLDFSEVALRIHREKDPAARVVQSSMEDPLPFADGAFDGVACLSVLFAISPGGARRALAEFRRVLRPGGRLVVTAMRPGASKLRAACKHVLNSWRRDGLRTFVDEMLHTLVPLLSLLYYNYRMYGLARGDGYRRLSAEELTGEMNGAGFVGVQCGLTYGGLFHLATANAPGAPERSPSAASVRCAESVLRPTGVPAWG